MKDDIKVLQISGWNIKRKPKKIDIEKVREALLGLLEDERKEKAEGFLAEVRQEEVDLVKQLEDKYGVGSIDLQAGEFIPAPEAPEAKEEAPAAPEVVEE